MNATNVRRSSACSVPSRKSSTASCSNVVGGGVTTRVSRQDEYKLEKATATAVAPKVEEKFDPDMIPCEFCGDMQYEETIMRHQVRLCF